MGAFVLARFELARQLRVPYSWLSLVMVGLISALIGKWLGKQSQTAHDWVVSADSAKIADLEFWGSASVTVEAMMELLRVHPPLLLGLFAGSLMMVPGLALTFGYDQIASDIQTRHARFLLVRLSRVEMYLGKTLAAFGLLVIAVTVALGLAGGVYLATATTDTGSDALLYLLRIWATTVVATIPYVTFLGLLNALCGRGWLSLMLCFVLWSGLWILGGISSAMDWPLDISSWLFPSYARHLLASDDWSDQLNTWVHGITFSIVSLSAGLWWFRRRDL